MMLPEKKEKIEHILGRELKTDEILRLNRISETLKIHDNDALWDIIIALEYQKHYYDTLPIEIRQILKDFTDNTKNILSSSDDSLLLRLQFSKIKKIFFINFLVLLLLIFNVISMWIGYSFATGSVVSFNTIFRSPIGYFFSVSFFTTGCLLLFYGMNSLAIKHKRWKVVTAISLLCIALSFLPFV